ncbi:hypothetical protein BJ138DRAFT_1112953 [Hygrophoropsis aurantiaca]|uniref:Uncharacterized protein n=1 Tax=Hygrophoropsis aurantiaca TaxID=72124 RepID=A0ACB8AET3_9AGAM|nr:hypothetical protein BJ138DRAFT_1112953 [Hygrophoropsis aurantiaca]
MQLLDLNQDIIFYILDSLLVAHKPGASSNEQPELATLARTCRALRDPALNVLWRTQYSLVPLLSTLPGDAWEVMMDTSDVWSGDLMFIFLTRPLRGSDWDRFCVYAPRIKHLYIGRANSIGPDWKGVHHSALRTLAAACPSAVQSCTWTNTLSALPHALPHVQHHAHAHAHPLPRLLPNLASFEIYTPSWILGSACDLSTFRACLRTVLHPALRTLKFEAAFNDEDGYVGDGGVHAESELEQLTDDQTKSEGLGRAGARMLRRTLNLIAQHCPRLETLAIEETSTDILLTAADLPSSSSSSSCSNLASSSSSCSSSCSSCSATPLAHLRSFTSGQNYRILFALDALCAVGMWNSLVELEITVSEDILPTDILSQKEGTFFPSLRRLALYTYAPALIPPFIAAVRSTQLEDVHLDVHATFTPATLPEVYACLAQRADTLTRLRVLTVNVLEIVGGGKGKKPSRSGSGSPAHTASMSTSPFSSYSSSNSSPNSSFHPSPSPEHSHSPAVTYAHTPTSILSPLFPLRTLRTVKILSRRLSRTVAISASDLLAIPGAYPASDLKFAIPTPLTQPTPHANAWRTTHAWPDLEVLDVCMFRSAGVTLATVAELAERCPRLWMLCVCVDLRWVPDIAVPSPPSPHCGPSLELKSGVGVGTHYTPTPSVANPTPPHPPTKLRILEVADSPVADLPRVAAFLAARLPSVRKVSFRRKYETQWEYVCETMTTGCRTRLRWPEEEEGSDEDGEDE